MSKHNTNLIETTIDGIDTNLIQTRADDKKAKLYRLTLPNGCYFAARSDMDADVFDQVSQLQPGINVRVCTFEEHGRRKIAWIRSAGHSLAPYDIFAQRQRNLRLLTISSCLLTVSLAAVGIGVSLIAVLAIFVAIISLLGCLLSICGLIDSLGAARVEAQERWQREPYRFEAERSDQ